MDTYCFIICVPRRRKWQPTPVFSPGKYVWTEELGGLPSKGWQRVGHDWAAEQQAFYFVWKETESIFARNYTSILDPILDKEDYLNLFRCMLYHSNTCGHDLVAQWCLILGNSVDWSLPGSSVHGIYPRQEYWSGLPFTFPSVQFSSVTQSCPTLCDPMNRSTPGLPVRHQLPEFTQTHVHRVGDAIQPSHPLSSPSRPAPNPSQHQSLFQWVNSSHEVAKVLEFEL